MSDRFFQIMGTVVPPMLGRSSIMQDLWSNLTKATPSHISIVGPRYSGKTVLMNGLAEQMRKDDSPYQAVIIWDLGHQTPDSNELFLKALCRKLGEGIKASGNEYGDHLLALENDVYGELQEIIEALYDEGFRILMLWDGFDKPLRSGKLTRNLWDQLRELASNPSLRLVTSTRLPLHELIRSEESVTSDFWNIFDMSPVRVSVFDENDRETIIGELPSLSFHVGAKTELENWSAGFPPLFLEILNQIALDTPSGIIKNDAVNRAAKKAAENLSDLISAMWQDCPAAAKDLYIHLLDADDILYSDVQKYEAGCLIEKGFAKRSGNKLLAACRMLQEHIQGAKQNTGSVARLFGSWDKYKVNIRGLLERRLAQISRFDDRLYHLVEQIINDIPDYPDDCLNNLTGIRDCALKLVWQRELGTDMSLPKDVIIYWTSPPRSSQSLVKSMMDTNRWDLPIIPLHQIRMLQLLTGSHLDFESKSKVISKNTYVLIDAIHTFRNRGQHPEGQSIHLGVAVAAIMTCLELLACLERELGR